MNHSSIRQKGKKGEAEFCEWLRETLCFESAPKNNLEQVRSGGGDVIEIAPYCFEVKRQEKLDLFQAWSQCVEAAKALNRIPIVAFRKNRQKWQFLIPAYFLHTSFENGYVRLTEVVFRRWIVNHYYAET